MSGQKNRIVTVSGEVTSWKLGPNSSAIVSFVTANGCMITFSASTFNLYQLFAATGIAVTVRLLVGARKHMLNVERDNN
jgi:hypothetical protein